jgi:hypothetical protein
MYINDYVNMVRMALDTVQWRIRVDMLVKLRVLKRGNCWIAAISF